MIILSGRRYAPMHHASAQVAPLQALLARPVHAQGWSFTLSNESPSFAAQPNQTPLHSTTPVPSFCVPESEYDVEPDEGGIFRGSDRRFLRMHREDARQTPRSVDCRLFGRLQARISPTFVTVIGLRPTIVVGGCAFVPGAESFLGRFTGVATAAVSDAQRGVYPRPVYGGKRGENLCGNWETIVAHWKL